MAMFIVECCNLFLLQSHLLLCRHGFCDVGVTLSKQTLEAQGGGGTLIFSCIRRLGPFFWGQIFEFQIFFGVFRKTNIFLGMKILWIFFWGLSQNWTSFRAYFYVF